MAIPKYIQERMERSRYDYDVMKKHSDYAAGYTVAIAKRSHYAYASTLHKEVTRLICWANKLGGEGTAILLKAPDHTTHGMQYAYVTIFDPVMQKIEMYVKA